MLRFGSAKKEFFGFDPRTTNNRMELMAPIQGLLALKEPCEVEITTDSQYVLQGITKWILKWKRIQWWRKRGPVANADLWMELDELSSLHKAIWIWTRGHAGHPDNTRCDWLAQKAAARSKVPGRTDGRTHPFASTWARIMCHRNRKPISSKIYCPATMRTRSNRSQARPTCYNWQ